MNPDPAQTMQALSLPAVCERNTREYDPVVVSVNLGEMVKKGDKIEQSVVDLWRKFSSAPLAVVPNELKNSYKYEVNPPYWSKPPFDRTFFLSDIPLDYAPAQRCTYLKDEFQVIYEKAKRNYEMNAPVEEWSCLVYQISREVERCFKQDLVLHNVEKCSIQPVELVPGLPDPIGPSETASTSVRTSSSNSTANDGPSKNKKEGMDGKLVDWTMGLRLSDDQLDLISEVYKCIPDCQRALNQTDGHIRNVPLAFDIVVKGTSSLDGFAALLGIWSGAALKKKRRQGWDTRMPGVGVLVDGHEWMAYIFFEHEKALASAGPFELGSTKSVIGIWKIYYQMYMLGHWASTKFKKWFEVQILNRWAVGVVKTRSISLKHDTAAEEGSASAWDQGLTKDALLLNLHYASGTSSEEDSILARTTAYISSLSPPCLD